MKKNGQKLTLQKKNNLLSLTNKKLPSKKWSFSFLYFKEIDYFGLSEEDNKWFIGVLNRLQDMSSKDEKIFGEKGEKKIYKLHPIDWNAKNIPIKRTDLNWLPKEYIDNDEEFPMWQFSISKGKGRVIGFFDETSFVFYVVLLDPRHNMQPSKDYDYSVDECFPTGSEYDNLLLSINEVKDRYRKKCTYSETCGILNDINTIRNQANIIYVSLNKEFYDIYKKLEEDSIQEVIEEFLMTKI